MKIVNIHIREFGALKDRSFQLGETVNIFRGDNESGKSTLLLFIKFMLYGLARKSRGAAVSEADRALSWDSDEAAGSLTVLHGGKLYRIDRRARRARQIAERVQVVDCETSLVMEGIKEPGEFFLGIPVEMFESSCSVAQLRCTGVDGEQVGAALENLLSSADESVDASRVLKVLDQARIKYLHKDGRGGSLFDLESRKEILENSYRQAVSDNIETEQLKSEIARTELTISETAKKKMIADELDSKINLRATAELFDLLHQQEDERRKKQDELASLTDSIKRGSFVPDVTYLARLTNVKREIDVLHSELEGAREKYASRDAELRADGDSYNRFRTVDDLGGFDEVRTRYKRQRVSGGIYLALAVFSVIMILCGVALGVLVKTLLFSVSGVALLLLAVSVLGMIHARKIKKTIASALLLDIRQLRAFFADSDSARMLDRQIREELSQIEASIRIKERMLRESNASAGELLASFSAVDKDSAQEVLDVLTESIDSIREYLDAYAELSGRISSISAQIGNLTHKLSDSNEHQIRHKISAEILAMTDEEISEAKKEKSFLDYQLKVLTQKKSDCDRRLLERRYTTQNPLDIAAKLDEVNARLEKEQVKYRALVLAIESINAATVNMRNTLTPKIREMAGAYISELSGSKYSEIGVDDRLDMSFVGADGFSRPLDSFSTGTKDMAYIALRLALLKLLPTDELPPLMLDETLAMVDSKRGANVLRMLESYCRDGGQCLFFSCHDREERLCAEQGIEYNLIEL